MSRKADVPIESLLGLPPLLKKRSDGEFECASLSKSEKRRALEQLKSRTEMIETTISAVHSALSHLMRVVYEK